MKNNSSLFYVCSLLEYIGRLCKIERSNLVHQLGKNNIKRLYKDADTLHCEPIEKIADEVISIYNITSGDFDNVLRCRYAVPDYWTIGAVYERLIILLTHWSLFIRHGLTGQFQIIIQIFSINPVSIFLNRGKRVRRWNKQADIFKV